MEIGVLFVVMFGLMALGAPIFLAMLIAVLVTLVIGDYGSATALPTQMAAGVDSYELLAIPFFILMGSLMSKAGLTERIVAFLMYFIGGIKGGLAYTVIGASAFASTVSGSAPAAASMIGSSMLPMMKRSGYRQEFSAAVVASSAVLGPVIPPSVPMVFVALVTSLSVGQLFMAGIVPGVLLIAGLFLVVVLRSRGTARIPDTAAVNPYREAGLRAVTVRAVPALLTPILIIAGVIGGFATVTEISILSSAYVLVLGLVYKSLDLRSVFQVFSQTALFSATIMMIFAAVGGFTYIVALTRLGTRVDEFVQDAGFGPVTFLLLTMLLFLLLGTIMDAIPAILIFVPVLLPSAIALGIDPIHYSAMIVVNLMVGLITPPVGALLFVTTKLARVQFSPLVREAVPFILVYFVVVVLTTFIPALTAGLPGLLF
ncbi:TRAP transporter large permease [Georgenia sp. 311]|nr:MULTISPECIES: TRAP transporter large permease [Georgenia]TNC18495.1 TRAP transporter large permease [Georgenia sp. 311]